MKRILFGLFVIFCVTVNAQTESYNKLVEALHESYPMLNLNNKLIVVNPWSLSETGSRELNKAFAKALATFEVAKLKGGRDGMIVVALNTTDSGPEAKIALKKDGAEKLILIDSKELNENGLFTGNAVFDSNGTIIYSNLESADVFPSIQKLITR